MMNSDVSSQRYILGAGAHGRVVADILESCQSPITGFLDDDPSLHGTTIGSWSVVGGSEILDNSPKADLIVAIGKAPVRLQLTKKFQLQNLTLINAIHINAVVSPSVHLGSGISVCAGAVANPHTVIKDAVIINTGATVDHDCQIGEGAHLSPGVHLAGRVKIGKLTFLGTGVNVTPRVRIGKYCIIGAGSLVINDIPDGVLAYGSPARVISSDVKTFDWNRLL